MSNERSLSVTMVTGKPCITGVGIVLLQSLNLHYIDITRNHRVASNTTLYLDGCNKLLTQQRTIVFNMLKCDYRSLHIGTDLNLLVIGLSRSLITTMTLLYNMITQRTAKQ